jgi:hypothetical protein
MEIKLYWPKCNFLHKKWGKIEIDSYWVECTLEEAEREVFPLLSTEAIKESKSNWRPRREDFENDTIETDRYCFLVSKDLSSIESYPWSYPYSGHWNAYCPFEAIEPIEIKKLKELVNMNIEQR